MAVHYGSQFDPPPPSITKTLRQCQWWPSPGMNSCCCRVSHHSIDKHKIWNHWQGQKKKKWRDVGKPTGMFASSRVKRFDVEMRLLARWKMREYLGEGWGKQEDRCGRRRRRRSRSLEPEHNKNVGQHRANMVVCRLGSLSWPPNSYNPQCDFFPLPLLFLMCCNYNKLGKQATKLGLSKPLLASTGSSRILGTTLKDISAGWGGLLGLLFSAS